MWAVSIEQAVFWLPENHISKTESPIRQEDGGINMYIYIFFQIMCLHGYNCCKFLNVVIVRQSEYILPPTKCFSIFKLFF